MTVAIIGGGPAGLMASEIISQAGFKTDVYDAMPSVGRKFLMAGKSGLNISHSEPFDIFLSRYGRHAPRLQPILENFGPETLIRWVHLLDIKTFVGSSGRIFPEGMKAAPLLRAWLHRLRGQGVKFHVRHQWQGWHGSHPHYLHFLTPQGRRDIAADAVVLALGGGSWPQLGSTGEWLDVLQRQDIPVAPLQPSNCGFDVSWSDHFRTRFAGQPLKSASASCLGRQKQGDCMITETGIEGGFIYTLSAALRDEIANAGSATLRLDLMPDTSLDTLISKLSKPRSKHSLSNFLRKKLGIEGVKAGLLRECLSIEELSNPVALGSSIKSLPVTLVKTRPISEAISTAGGLCFEALDDNLMLASQPGIFCAGEMLDWDAPTGGYLLTACFASGRMAGEGAVKWLSNLSNKP